MTYQASGFAHDQTTLPKLPSWVTSSVGETPGNVAFLSGAALATLDALLRDEAAAVPHDLLANTLALRAAAATSKVEGRMAREADIRDSYRLTSAGDAMGPDGEMLAYWREAVRLRFKRSDWPDKIAERVPMAHADRARDWIETGLEASRELGPLAAVALMIETVLTTDDRAERVACLLADVILAKSLRWERPLPLTALHLTKTLCRDIAGGETGAKQVVQQAVLKSVIATVRLSHALAERAAAVRLAAPKLRAKSSDAAVSLFLSEDAVAPAMLASHGQGTAAPMSPRAARRFCDRLVELGVARELTGRDSFRLYGVAP